MCWTARRWWRSVRYRVKNPAEHLGETRGLEGFLGAERARLFDDAAPERREKLRAAERTREVYRAWNDVCRNTREGSHATGLHYLPETNELLVYMDSSAWTQEMAMLREIIRARMAALGVDVEGLIFKTSREGYRSAASSPAAPSPARSMEPVPSPLDASGPRADLTPAEAARLDEEVSSIEDDGLREALKNAMRASFEWRKGLDARKKA